MFVCFKTLTCLFNVLKKFASVRRRPSEAAVLSSTNWINVLQTSRSMTRNHSSALSFAIRQSSCFADAAQLSARLPDNVTKSECLFYWGLRSQCVFVLSCGLLLQIEWNCGVPSVDKSINTSTCLLGKVFVQKQIMCRQWRFRYSGLTRVFDYTLYCRTRAGLLCMFVPTPTSLINVVNSGSFHWHCQCSYIFVYVGLPC